MRVLNRIRRLRARSALLVAVPEAEPIMALARGSQTTAHAHVTVLYPFAPRWRVNRGLIAKLRGVIIQQPAFTVTLTNLGTFEGAEQVTYLAPEPADPFRRLTLAIAQRWPRWPPYGGRFVDLVPHMSILDGRAPPVDFEAQLAPLLPVRIVAQEVLLVMPDQHGWETLAHCPLGKFVRGPG